MFTHATTGTQPKDKNEGGIRASAAAVEKAAAVEVAGSETVVTAVSSRLGRKSGGRILPKGVVAPAEHKSEEEESRQISRGEGTREQGIKEQALDREILDYHKRDRKTNHTQERERRG